MILMKKHNILFLSLVLYILIVSACNQKQSISMQPSKVTVVTVEKVLVQRYRDLIGQLVADEQVDLRARITGILEKQNFKEGDFVKKGQLLFVIQKAEYEANLMSTEGQVKEAEASVKNKTINYERQKLLYHKKAVSELIYQQSIEDKLTAEGELLVAKADYSLAKLNLSYTEIKAPLDGKTGSVTYDPGNLLSTESSSLLDIVKMDPILAEFSFSEAHILDILENKQKRLKERTAKNSQVDDNAKGKLIQLRLFLANGQEYSHLGEIIFMDNVINPLTGTMKLKGSFPNPNNVLVPGGYVRIRLERTQKSEVILIPQVAVQNDQLGPYVFTINKDNKAEQKYITHGETYGTYIKIDTGIAVGDVVVTEGQQKIKNGQIVNPQEAVSKKDDQAEAADAVKTQSITSNTNSDSSTQAVTIKPLTAVETDSGINENNTGVKNK